MEASRHILKCAKALLKEIKTRVFELNFVICKNYVIIWKTLLTLGDLLILLAPRADPLSLNAFIYM